MPGVVQTRRKAKLPHLVHLTRYNVGIYRLLLSDYAKPVNIGNPNEISLKDFAEEIIKLTGTTQKIVHKPLPVDDPKQRKPDISKAKSILGWEPKVDRAKAWRRK